MAIDLPDWDKKRLRVICAIALSPLLDARHHVLGSGVGFAPPKTLEANHTPKADELQAKICCPCGMTVG
jgi:hypothetical protein